MIIGESISESDVTTIQIPKKLLKELKSSRDYSRQTYAELLERMAKVYKKVKLSPQYDLFLHTAQQVKMKELWDNPHDEAWEDA